jgi:cyclase
MLRVMILFAVLATAVLGQGTAQEKRFTVERLADGVYALIRKEPASLWFTPNNVFVIGRDGVVVVDANITSEQTREVLAEFKRITDKPVRYVVNTHWHEDHIIGNRVYREEFPDVKFVGHRSTLTDLPEIGSANRKSSLQNGRGFVGLLEGKLDKGENLAGQPISEEERLGYASDVKLISAYLAESKDFDIILPTVVVDDRLEIDLGDRKIEVLHLGRAHTGGDLVVRLPKENIVIAGDLLVHPVPLVGSTSYPLEYAATLEKLKALKAKTIVPGHGPVMHDTAYLDAMIELLASIKQQTEVAFARGKTLEQMRKSVDLEPFRKRFAGRSQHKSLIFKNYVTLPAVAAAHKQLTENKEAKK